MTKYLRSFLILLIVIGLGYWFVRGLDWQLVALHLREVRALPLATAAILILLTMLVRSWRWRLLLEPIARVELRHVLAATVIGFGSVFIIGRSGELVRPLMLSARGKLRPSATIATLLVERIFDLAAVIGFFAINLIVYHRSFSHQPTLPDSSSLQILGLVLLGGVTIGAGLLVIFAVKSRAFTAWIEARAEGSEGRIIRGMVNFVKHLADGLSVLLNRRALALALLQTIGVWCLVTLATWLVLIAFRLPFSWPQALFILGFGLVGSVVPSPGGSAGAFHAVAAAGLAFLGVEKNLAASVAILLHFVSFGSPFLLAIVYLVRDGIGVGQFRQMLFARAENPAAVPQ